MTLLAEIQDLRGDIDLVFEGMGQTVKVIRRAPVPEDDGPPPDLVNGLTPVPTISPVQDADVFPAYGYQLSEKERQQYGSVGADLAVPLWLVLVRWTANLDQPGFSLELQGGELSVPLPLRVVGDAEDMGTVRVCWRLLCQATQAR